MAYTHYTSCFVYKKGDKPYNEKSRLAFLAGELLKILIVTLIAAGAGFVTGAGPIGALLGGIVGYFSALTGTIDEAASQWLYHRLICLSKDNPKCAVGIVSYDPYRSDLGAFDNDQYVDVVLMPHPVASDSLEIDPGKWITALLPCNGYKLDGGMGTPPYRSKFIPSHPGNIILADRFQGEELLAPVAELEADLGYTALKSHEMNALHCEAEGDFWVKVKDWAPALAILLTAALVGTAAATGAGYAAGTAIGCAIGFFFFGPIGCAILGALGGLLGAAAGAAAGAALSYVTIKAVLQAMFDADPGNIEDSNVGDRALGPIRMGDAVAVLGEHVYDGYHDGWNEFHPLMAIMKFNQTAWPSMPPTYLMWQPDEQVPAIIPETVNPSSPKLDPMAMRFGLDDPEFRSACEVLRFEWCKRLKEAFSPETRQTQQGLEHRWTIHPDVDGCIPERDPDPIH